jgi:hypothetical protein
MLRTSNSVAARVSGILVLIGTVSAAAQQSAPPSDEQISAQNALSAVTVGLGACVRGYASSQVLTQAPPAEIAAAAISSCRGRSRDWQRAFVTAARLEARDNGAHFDGALAQKQAEDGVGRIEDTLRQNAAKAVIQMRTPK